MCTGIFNLLEDGNCYLLRTLEFALVLNYIRVVRPNMIETTEYFKCYKLSQQFIAFKVYVFSFIAIKLKIFIIKHKFYYKK